MRKTLLGPTPLRRLALPLSALALVAAVMAASSGTGEGTSRLRAGPSSIVFTVLVTFLAVAVVLVLVALVLVATNVRTARADQAPAEPRRRRLTMAVVVTALAAFIAFLLFRLRKHPFVPRARGGAAAPGAPHVGSSPIHFVPAASYVTAGIVLALVLGFLALPVLLRARRGGFTGLRGLDGAPLEPGDVAGSPDDDGEVMRAVAAVRLADPSEEPDVRRAVVTAYLHMAAAAAAAGAPRGRGETAQEFLVTLLDSLGVRSGPARDLTAVFERARYSDEPVGEAERATALRALEEIRADLAAAGAVGVPA